MKPGSILRSSKSELVRGDGGENLRQKGRNRDEKQPNVCEPDRDTLGKQ